MLSSFAKVFEKLLSIRLIKFFKKNNVFTKNQHGFLSNRGVDSAIYELTQGILEALENGDITLAFFLDISKAFDCVEHDRLLKKIEICGIRNKQLHLIESYLKNRTQKVTIESNIEVYTSLEKEVKMGVPQGSILGPLLFLIYINDLPNQLQAAEHNIVIYADDTNVITSSKNLQNSVNNMKVILRTVERWCSENLLYLNLNKTECAVFQTEQSKCIIPERIQLENTIFEPTKTVKFLGLCIDTSLKWKGHVDTLNKKLNSVIYTFNVMRHHVKEDIMKNLYFANFQSLLSYGIVFWGNSPHHDRIFKTQKHALRTIYHIAYRKSCRGVFKDNGILTCIGLYVLKCVVFIRSHSEYFKIYINRNQTRRTHFFIYPKRQLSLTQSSVEYMCMKLYNSLPKEIKSIDDISMFRREVYAFLLSCEPYNINEFFEKCRTTV